MDINKQCKKYILQTVVIFLVMNFLVRIVGKKVNEMFDLDLPESDEYMIVGGLILHEYQSFPKLNEIVTIGRYEFKIVKNTATKIELVRLKVAE